MTGSSNNRNTSQQSFFWLLADSFRDPRARPLHRVVILFVIGLILSVVWAYAAAATERDVLRNNMLIGGGFLVGGWSVMALAMSRGMPFMPRLILTGALPLLAWMGITYSFGFQDAASPLLVGIVSIWALIVLLLIARSWLVIMGPAEVYAYRPIVGLLRFASSPLDEMGNPTLNHLWISPLDSIKLFWLIDDRVAINRRYDDIITAEGYAFSLEVRLLAEFDPAQIRATMFELKLVYMESRQDIAAMLQSIVESVVEITARDFFIEMTHQEALAAGTVTRFKAALPGLVSTQLVPIGLRVLPGSVTCIPHGSEEARRAADRAAAAPFETVASLSVQKELLRQALDGSVPAQLVLYAQMAAHSGTGGGPGYIAMSGLPEHFLQAVNQQDQREAKRLFTHVFGEAEEARYREVSGRQTARPGQRRRSFDLGQLDDQ
jgi:hypothetical protein